jgi:hypothetical protein
VSTTVRSPSGRIDVVASGEAWRLYIDGVQVACGEGDEAHASALERLAADARGRGDGELERELAEAARYWREDGGRA